MLSSGATKDLLVLSFANSLINVSKQDATKEDENLPHRYDNKAYKINKRIDRRLEKLGSKMTSTIQEVYEIGGQKTVLWIRNNLNKRIKGLLIKLQEDKINLEMLAIWVLYCNFSEGRSKLIPQFEWLKDGKQFIELADMLEETKVANLQGNMFESAYDAISIIKG